MSRRRLSDCSKLGKSLILTGGSNALESPQETESTPGDAFLGIAVATGRVVVELAEGAQRPSGLTQDGSRNSAGAGDLELVGEVRARAPAAPTAAALQTPSSRPWPVILAGITFAVDLLAVTISTYLARAVAHDKLFDGSFAPTGYRVYVTLAVWPVVFAIYGLYDLRRPTHATAELQRLFHAVLMSLLLVVLIAFIAEIDISLGFIVWLLGFSIVSIVSGRLVTRRLAHALNAGAVTSQVTLIAGTNDEARALARTLQRRPWMGYRVCGFVDVTPSGLEVVCGLPVLGMIDDIARISQDHGVRAVIVAGSAAGGATLQRIDSALSVDISVRVSPGLPNLGAARVILEPIDGMALFSLRRHRFSRRQRFLKRSLDNGVTSVALVVGAPPMIVIALLVRLSSPGPILFRQRRVGEQERTFTILKFRTMVMGADAQRDDLEGHNEADGTPFHDAPRSSCHQGGPLSAAHLARRITPALQRHARRDEPGGSAAGAPRGDHPLRRGTTWPIAGQARCDRALASQRTPRSRLR
jgi:CoA-binding domain/Bacterial sugar transferase